MKGKGIQNYSQKVGIMLTLIGTFNSQVITPLKLAIYQASLRNSSVQRINCSAYSFLLVLGTGWILCARVNAFMI